MLRSLKSAQRKVRIIAVRIAADDTLTGLDANQVSASGGLITFDQAFAEIPIVIAQSDDGTVTVTARAKGSVQIDTAKDADVLIIGSDITDRI